MRSSSPSRSDGDLSADSTTWRFWSASALKVWKNSSWVEFLADDELHVVHHQDVDRAEQLLERHGVLVPDRPDELVHELFGREIDDLLLRLLGADVPGDGVHQVGLAEPDAAIEEQRVERHAVGLRHPQGRGVRQLVRLADHEILEGEARIERRGHAFDAVIVAHRRWPAPARRRPARPRWRRRRRALSRSSSGTGRCGVDDHLDGADLRILRAPQRLQAIGIVGRHPVAHEARRHRHAQVRPALAGQIERLQPGPEGRLAEFRPQPTAHARPLRVQHANRCSIPSLPTPDNLVCARSLLDPRQIAGLPAIGLAAMALRYRRPPRSRRRR